MGSVFCVFSSFMPRRANRPLKAKPTTVRFEKPLDEWLKARAAEHPDGQSGIVNDAVRYFKEHLEEQPQDGAAT